MIRILTGLPRPNGVGEYVAQLASIGVPAEIFYGRPMTPEAFERTISVRPGALRGAADWTRMHLQGRDVIDRTHVAWEGFGPVYGSRTRLMTVHHALAAATPWEHRPPRSMRRSIVFGMARRGHRRAVRWGTRLVVPSLQSVRQDLVGEYGADPARIEVIPHFIDTGLFRPMDRAACRARLGLSPLDPVLLHVGVDDGRKNVQGLLELFHRFRRTHPSSCLVQIGRSPTISGALRGPEGDGVRVIPEVPGAESAGLYNSADVVLPTYQEGFGRAALEALACGVPVVVSDLPVFREELGPHFRGATVDHWEPWMPLLEEAIGDPGGAARAAWVTQRFPRSAFEKAYRSLYAESLV